MAELKVASEVVKIDSTIDSVYSLLSDFEKIGMLADLAKQSGMASDQMKMLADKVEDLRFDGGVCTVTVKGMGDITVEIVEREAPKMIKYQSGGALPFQFTMWVQLLENGPYDTRLKLTIASDMNMVFRMMLKGKLEKGINQMAQGLAKIPYMILASK